MPRQTGVKSDQAQKPDFMSFTEQELQNFSEAAQSLKLYRRAELLDESGRHLIQTLYVDPLPQDALITATLKPNTTFLIGRKGTGKSTIFQKAQAELRSRNNVVSAYIDIKTVYEESQTDPGVLAKIADAVPALPQPALEKLLLYRGFIASVLAGIRNELERKLRESFWAKIKESFTGTIEELFEDFDTLLYESSTDKYLSIVATKVVQVQEKSSKTAGSTAGCDLAASATPSAKLDLSSQTSASHEGQQQFSDILLRTFKLKELLLTLKDLLAKAGIRHLYIFVDDFSELPPEAMQVTVDTLLAPLNNWSEEFVKFKVAAYPSRGVLRPNRQNKDR